MAERAQCGGAVPERGERPVSGATLRPRAVVFKESRRPCRVSCCSRIGTSKPRSRSTLLVERFKIIPGLGNNVRGKLDAFQVFGALEIADRHHNAWWRARSVGPEDL